MKLLTVQFMRKIARFLFDKKNKGNYNRLDKVLVEMKSENKENDK